ncbi:MAG: hypothetical protein GXO30_02215 [Epsilonproteobacteria bacterium]|nr:hypothetical protein [Campylobacterota bacterium]
MYTKTILKCLKYSFVLMSFTISVNANATPEDVHKIIDICASSQKVMKDYALIGMRIIYHDPQKDLTSTLKHLDTEMDELASHPLSKNLHEEELQLQKGWQQIARALLKKPSKKTAIELRHEVDDFANQCEKVASDIATDTNNDAENEIVHISRLDLDVQELAGDYVMKAWDAMSDDEYYKDVHEIKEDYQKEYNLLESADDKLVSEKIKKHLKMLDKQFMMFEFMAESHSGRFVPLLIAKKADIIHAKTVEILNEDESEEEK